MDMKRYDEGLIKIIRRIGRVKTEGMSLATKVHRDKSKYDRYKAKREIREFREDYEE